MRMIIALFNQGLQTVTMLLSNSTTGLMMNTICMNTVLWRNNQWHVH